MGNVQDISTAFNVSEQVSIQVVETLYAQIPLLVVQHSLRIVFCVVLLVYSMSVLHTLKSPDKYAPMFKKNQAALIFWREWVDEPKASVLFSTHIMLRLLCLTDITHATARLYSYVVTPELFVTGKVNELLTLESIPPLLQKALTEGLVTPQSNLSTLFSTIAWLTEFNFLWGVAYFSVLLFVTSLLVYSHSWATKSATERGQVISLMRENPNFENNHLALSFFVKHPKDAALVWLWIPIISFGFHLILITALIKVLTIAVNPAYWLIWHLV